MKTRTQRSIGRLVGIMVTIVVAGVLIARSYYGNLNRSVDPRILQARKLYEQYDRIAQTGDYYLIFALLDSISDIYLGTPAYAGSFELGVLHNNRAAALLTIALYGDSIPDSLNPLHRQASDTIVAGAEKQIRMAISIYEGWNSRFDGKENAEIRKEIEGVFMTGLEQTEAGQAGKYLTNRVKEIRASLEENQRRLSVCYTNLGLVYRMRKQYPEAVAQYEMAMELWDRNLDAENNLNKLLGRPLKKRNFIQKLFPPGKDFSNRTKTKQNEKISDY